MTLWGVPIGFGAEKEVPIGSVVGVGAHRVRKRVHRPKKSAHRVWGSVSDSKIKVFS